MDAAETDSEFLSLLDWLTKHTGLKFREDQHQHTMTTIRRLMTAADASAFAEFQRRLRRDSQLLSDLIDQLTVGETYFFREHQHFQFIRHKIIPDLRSRRGHLHPIRAWSAACASGEEAYSLAIVFTQEQVSSKSSILATDLSSAAIEKARRAVFRPWSFRGEASDAVRAFAEESEDQYTLCDNIKRRVQFQRLNLAANTYPSPANGTCNLDLILCRNVLIYFGSETVRDIGRRLFECLEPGGWLITASGDPQLAESANFDIVASERGVFYRRPLEAQAKSKVGLSDVSKAQPATKDGIPHQSSGGFVPSPQVTSRADIETSPKGSRSKIAEAAAALNAEDFARAASLTQGLDDDSSACLVRIKAVAATDPSSALEICRLASLRHPLVEELHYLHGVLLADADQPLPALESIRKAIFLNRTSVMSHFLFASIQLRQGQYQVAGKHFRRVCDLCAVGNPDDVLPMSSGETVSDIALAAQSQLARIELRRDS